MKKEPHKPYVIKEMQAEDVEPATRMRYDAWLDTYVNEEYGVTEDWIKERMQKRASPEIVQRVIDALKSPDRAGWVAKNAEGEVIGAAMPLREEDDTQHVGSLYVDKRYHGTGLGHDLMRKIIDWSDPQKPLQLGVVTYNERAKAFYRKWGFEEIPDSEQLYADKMPEITMIRKGDKQNEV